ncbi:MAG: serine/threonine protein kinase [Ktedonobacteraceae bacterium]|nr:serine/threonine protein kinase [Ktedonobacteraceae bacterium]
MGNSSSGITLNNRYRLERKIGDGGFAQVFLATDLALERKVAVKVLAQSWVKDQDQLVRFKNEARAIAALEHPNILLIYDVGATKNGVPYLVMPYISGGTLADRMKQGPFTLDEIGAYLAQIGSALDYAHQRGIIHRDVKPSNLLIRPDGQLV